MTQVFVCILLTQDYNLSFIRLFVCSPRFNDKKFDLKALSNVITKSILESISQLHNILIDKVLRDRLAFLMIYNMNIVGKNNVKEQINDVHKKIEHQIKLVLLKSQLF